MARHNGVHSGNAGPRKGLIQPVLPALSLLPRVKKETVQEKEQNDNVAAESAPQKDKTIGKQEDDRSKSPPVAVDQVPEVQQTEVAEPRTINVGSPAGCQNEQTEPVGPDLPHNLDDPNVKINSPEPDQELLYQDAAYGLLSRSGELGEFNLEEGMGGSSSKSHGISVPIDEEKHNDPQTASSDDMPAIYTQVSGSAAPEAVTGNVETLLSVHHSTQPSISNSSIQQTPKHGITVPVSPVSAETAHNQINVNGINHMSPSHLVNGNMHSIDASGLANGLTLSLSSTGRSSFPTVLEHIRDIQFTTHWFDCDICVYFPQSIKPIIYRNVHSLILIRSPRLRNFIYPQRAGQYSYFIINLAPARAIDTNAFDAALRFLYNDNILSAENLFPSNVAMDKAGRSAALNYILSYMVAGMELGLEPVTTRALDLVGRLLDWDLAELAVKEAIVLRSSAVNAENPHTPPDTLFVAKSILQHVFNLVILGLNVKSFAVNATATSTDLTSRLANFEGGRAIVNPVLANMVFGSMPASSNLSPTLTDVVSGQDTNSPDYIASVIMLNMDFEDLYGLAGGMKKVHGDEGVRVISEVVQERERRRLSIANNRSTSNKQRMTNAGIWDVIGWHEFMINGDLRRERVDFLLPKRRGGNNGGN